jgi:prepilin-type N-terminal cleavage/methylation domain-containing protein
MNDYKIGATNGVKIKCVNRGFSLIEMLVAVALFTFVTFVAITTLFMMQTVNTRMKTTKSIYDNMFIVIDDISRETKYGTYFNNFNHTLTIPATCIQKDCISYEYLNNETLISEIHGYYLSPDKAIYKYTETAPNIYKSEKITTDDIQVNTLTFILDGNNSFNDLVEPETKHPSVKLIVNGITKNEPIVQFNIESYLTQRIAAN